MTCRLKPEGFGSTPIDYRSAVARIDSEALAHNMGVIRSYVGDRMIMPMVKANAYGHGMVECARALRELGADAFGVAFASEGAELRRAGITEPIVVMTPPLYRDIAVLTAYDLEPVLCSHEAVSEVSRHCHAQGMTIRAHLYIDTGMSRDGVRWDEARDFWNEVRTSPGIDWYGLATHFASADDQSSDFYDVQLRRFVMARQALQEAGAEFKCVHAANSAALLRNGLAQFDMVRPGLSIHGYSAFELPKDATLRPTLSLRARVLSVRGIEAGESVSYGQRYIAGKRTRIATISMGYGDGLSRALSGSLEVLISGRRYRSVGTICMDEFMVEIGDHRVQRNDEVVIIGSSGSEVITAEEIAGKVGTIPYEVLTAISGRVQRVW